MNQNKEIPIIKKETPGRLIETEESNDIKARRKLNDLVDSTKLENNNMIAGLIDKTKNNIQSIRSKCLLLLSVDFDKNMVKDCHELDDIINNSQEIVDAFENFISEKKKESTETEEEKSKKIIDVINSVHFLKGNFTAFISLCDLLKVADLTKDKFQECTDMIIGGVQETESTLESLRENKLNKIEKSEINLSDHLGTYIELLIKNAEGKKIKIDNQISKDIKVKAGNNELKIILHNLISNAIKFTNNGIISLRSEKDGDFVKIYVADNGVGISKEKLAKFSSENFVESTEGTNNETGTGTGIRAVYKSVEEMGGSISVESEEGKGTTFIVTLPAGENSVENK